MWRIYKILYMYIHTHVEFFCALILLDDNAVLLSTREFEIGG